MTSFTPDEQKAVIRTLGRRYAELECWQSCTPETEGRFDLVRNAERLAAELVERQATIARWTSEALALRSAIGKLTKKPVPTADRKRFIAYRSGVEVYSSSSATREKNRIYHAICDGRA